MKKKTSIPRPSNGRSVDCCQQLRDEIGSWILGIIVVGALVGFGWMIHSLSYNDGVYAGRRWAFSIRSYCSKQIKLKAEDIKEFYTNKLDYDNMNLTAWYKLQDALIAYKMEECIKEEMDK